MSKCNHTFHRLGGIEDCPVCNPQPPADRLERELSEATEMIDVWKSRSEINGKLAMKMQDDRDQALSQAAALAGALDQIGRGGPFESAAPHDMKVAREALAAYREFLKGRE